MTAGLALASLALTAWNLQIGRSLLYPPALFCAAWAGYMAATFLAGDTFLPVSADTSLPSPAGVIATRAGSAAVLLPAAARTAPPVDQTAAHETLS